MSRKDRTGAVTPSAASTLKAAFVFLRYDVSDTPQLENGYTQIANEIMDALIKFRIPGEERQCLDFILRKTYGYHKNEDMISNSQFVEATGLKRGNVSRSIKNLVNKNIVIKNDNKRIPTYRFNKNYKTWKVLSKVIHVIKSDSVVIKSDNKVLSKVMPTKDSKDNIQKKEKKKFIPPTLDEVVYYFKDKGYSLTIAKKAFEYYSTADWKDSRGNKVQNWKQKMIAVWFKDENKAEEKKYESVEKPCIRCGSANWSMLKGGVCNECLSKENRDKNYNSKGEG